MTDKRKDEMKQYDKYIAQMDAHEMACRLAEAAMGIERLAGRQYHCKTKTLVHHFIEWLWRLQSTWKMLLTIFRG